MQDREKSPYTGFKGSLGTKPIHSGGFRPSTAPKEPSSTFLNANPSVVTDFYTTLGVNHSIQSNLDKMKQQRFNNLQKQLAKGFTTTQYGDNIMKIYDGVGRKQEVSHIPSSLLEPTLENVQARLEAHRMDMRPLEDRYYQMKGIRNPLRGEEDREMKKVSVEEEAKEMIYRLKSGEIGVKSKKQQEDEELERMFEEKKRLDPKLAEYDRKFREYKLEKEAIEQTKFQQNQSKIEKRNNSSQKYPSSSQKDKKILQYHQQQQDHEIEVIELEKKYDPSKILATNNDKFICKYIFKQLDKEKKEIISKQELYDFMLGNEMFMSNFKIDLKWFYSDIEMFETKRKGLMNVEQMTRFLVQNKLKAHPQIQLIDPKAPPSNKSSSNCLLTTSQLNRLQQLYKSIDKQDDKIVKREELISVIYNDQYIISRLNNPAIKIYQINKTITLKQVLQLILNQYRSVKNQTKKKAKQYITLPQFLDYFTNIPLTSLCQQPTTTQQSLIYDLDSQHLQLLKDIFDRVPRVFQNYIATIDFVQQCRRDPQYKMIMEDICRIQSVETGLGAETVRAVMNRVGMQTDEFENWESVKLFFTRRGRPIGWDLEKIKKKRELREKERKEQFNKMLKGLNPEQKQRYLASLQTNKTTPSKIGVFNGINYTFPKPFDITDQRRKVTNKIHCQGMMDGQREFEELKVGIEALEVNKEMLQPKLEEMERKRKLKSDKRREESRRKAMGEEKPFKFHERDLIAKVLKDAMEKEERDKKKVEENIKPIEPPSNLKKTYKQIMQQQERKRKQKKKQQNKDDPEVSKRLYPDDPAAMKKEKQKKILQKQRKLIQAQQKKKQQLQKQKKRLAEKNNQKSKKLKQLKQQQQKQRKDKQKLQNQNQNLNYKPKINNFEDTGKREQGKRRRQQKQKQQIQQMIRRKQQQRNKRLNYKPQQEPKLNIKDMDEEDIIDRLSEISLSDLLEEQERVIWQKRRNFQKIPFSNKYKTNKQRQKAIMMRQRKLMQQQQKSRRQQLRNTLQNKLQNKKDQFQKGISNQNEKNKDKRLDPKSLNSKFSFNQSRALKRYYELMEGKVPLSEYDRMSNEGRSVVSEAEVLRMVRENDEDVDI